MTNIIFIEYAPYAEVKKALLQWIAMYEDLDPAFTFTLYEDVAASCVIIKADEKLSNEHFAYLVNYLKYPEGISFKASINGYTEITEENFFPGNLSGNKIMLFIPDSDTEYDNVHWVTTNNQVYKTDMGAKTTKIQSNETYQAWDLATTIFPPSETLHIERRNSKSNQVVEDNEKSEEKISGRFKVLLIIITILLIIVFLYRKINIEFSSTLYLFLLVGITAWFLADHEMLRVVRFFNLAFIIAALLVFYGYFFVPEEPPESK